MNRGWEGPIIRSRVHCATRPVRADVQPRHGPRNRGCRLLPLISYHGRPPSRAICIARRLPPQPVPPDAEQAAATKTDREVTLATRIHCGHPHAFHYRGWASTTTVDGLQRHARPRPPSLASAPSKRRTSLTLSLLSRVSLSASISVSVSVTASVSAIVSLSHSLSLPLSVSVLCLSLSSSHQLCAHPSPSPSLSLLSLPLPLSVSLSPTLSIAVALTLALTLSRSARWKGRGVGKRRFSSLISGPRCSRGSHPTPAAQRQQHHNRGRRLVSAPRPWVARPPLSERRPAARPHYRGWKRPCSNHLGREGTYLRVRT